VDSFRLCSRDNCTIKVHTNSRATNCTSPTGFANTVVFPPDALATTNHKIADSFVNTHYVYYTESPNIAPSQASIASFCLDQCIAYQANATGNVPCLSFNIDMGTIYPPNPNDTAIRWLCTAFDPSLTPELYQALEPDVDSYMHAVGVNRVCEGTFRAY